MLHLETIQPPTLSLLKELMEIQLLQPFTLVGVTALALRYGHRSSIDLDLFSNETFDNEKIADKLKFKFGANFVFESGHKNPGIFCYIHKIKVDIVYFPHKLIAPIETTDKIRMYGSADIAAMKIQVILGRGKKKDFWDLYELLRHFPLQQLIDWHQGQMLAISIPNAITYFVDAEESEIPVTFKKQTWEGVKKGIQLAVRDYLR